MLTNKLFHLFVGKMIFLQEISTWITKLNEAERKNGKKTFFTGTPVVCEAKSSSVTNLPEEKPSVVSCSKQGLELLPVDLEDY